MIHSLSLTTFRSHQKKKFEFKKTTVIVGRNTAGKTNILEAINFLATATSFRAEKDIEVVSYEKEFARIEGEIQTEEDKETLTIIISSQNNRATKKYLVGGVPRQLRDFVSYFSSTLFTPIDIEIISSTPGTRRKYIDTIIRKINTTFYRTEKEFEKALKARNRMLLDMKREKKFYAPKDFEYWDEILIRTGQEVTKARQELVNKINELPKDIFNFTLEYDKSPISKDRLAQYHEAERAVGQTLVGPTKDDFIFYFPGTKHEIKEYASRGEQRLTILQAKIAEIDIVKAATGHNPTLLLDDIFSELDEKNIEKIYDLINNQQTIITTTHEEFIPEKIRTKEGLSIIHL